MSLISGVDSPTITIIIKGGSLSQVYSTDPHAKVIVIDKDAVDGDEERYNKAALALLESDIDSGKVFEY